MMVSGSRSWGTQQGWADAPGLWCLYSARTCRKTKSDNIRHIISKRSSYETSVSLGWYLWVLIFWSPDIRARASAIVGIVTRRFMYPLPAQVFAEINVQAPHATALRLSALSMKLTNCKAFDIEHKHYIRNVSWIIKGSLGTNSFSLSFFARFWWAVAVSRKWH